MKKLEFPLLPDSYYHVFGHTPGSEPAFVDQEDYFLFLDRFSDYMSDYCRILGYCILPNEYHFILRIHNESFFGASASSSQFLSNQLRRMFTSFTMYVNKRRGRTGNLFVRPFKREEVDDQSRLRSLIRTIHFLPVEHGLCEELTEWQFSSFYQISSRSRDSILAWGEIIDLFESMEAFSEFHNRRICYPFAVTVHGGFTAA